MNETLTWILGCTASLFLGMLISWVLRPMFEGYAKRRGELLAERLYAAELEQEKARGRQQVDQENEAQKADLAQAGQLRLAAMDKRLQAHQDAYFLWTQLYGAMHTPEVITIVIECQNWWNLNCLFLEEDVRKDFSDAVFAASTHDNLVRMSQGDFSERSGVDENWAKILKPATTIQLAVALPPIVRMIAEKEATPAKG